MNRISALGSLLGGLPLSTAIAAPDRPRHPQSRVARVRLAAQCRGLGRAAGRVAATVRSRTIRPIPISSNAQANAAGKGATVRIVDTKDPILKPWAAAQMQKTNEELFKGHATLVPFTAQSRCFPGGVPGQLLWPFEPFYVIQTPKIVYMMWQRDHWVRRIHMTDKHSEDVKPSWFGELIGRYENGDTLVVDTIGLSTKMSFIDNFRTPHTEKLHVVERFTISPDGKNLTAIVTVNDPDTFNGPITLSKQLVQGRPADGRIGLRREQFRFLQSEPGADPGSEAAGLLMRRFQLFSVGGPHRALLARAVRRARAGHCRARIQGVPRVSGDARHSRRHVHDGQSRERAGPLRHRRSAARCRR